MLDTGPFDHPTAHTMREGAVQHLQQTRGNNHIARLLAQRKSGGASAKQPTLQYGSVGKAVKKLQQRLNAAGAEPPLKVDGIFGPKTRAATVAFQQGHTDPDGEQLKDDGIVGEKTWGALDLVAAEPDIEATDEALGKHVVEEMDANNLGPHTATEGIHYPENYKAGFPKLWKDDYWNGYADPTYFQRIDFMDWVLKPGMSASAAIKSWIRGLTIAECNTAIVAIRIDTLRAAIGDAKFDAHFGSTDTPVPEANRLRIKPGTAATPVEKFMKRTDAAVSGDAGTIGKRPANVGDKYYFYNHPKYLLKHPGGAWQGENAIYMGEQDGRQIWSGMGASNVTEEEMLNEMVSAYNGARDDRDREVLQQRFGSNPPAKYDPANGEFPDQIGVADILTAPPYEIDGETRKGGFLVEAGQTFDASKVQELRDE